MAADTRDYEIAFDYWCDPCQALYEHPAEQCPECAAPLSVGPCVVSPAYFDNLNRRIAEVAVLPEEGDHA